MLRLVSVHLAIAEDAVLLDLASVVPAQGQYPRLKLGRRPGASSSRSSGLNGRAPAGRLRLDNAALVQPSQSLARRAERAPRRSRNIARFHFLPPSIAPGTPRDLFPCWATGRTGPRRVSVRSVRQRVAHGVARLFKLGRQRDVPLRLFNQPDHFSFCLPAQARGDDRHLVVPRDARRNANESLFCVKADRALPHKPRRSMANLGECVERA
jgi:hypothetical protein